MKKEERRASVSGKTEWVVRFPESTNYFKQGGHGEPDTTVASVSEATKFQGPKTPRRIAKHLFGEAMTVERAKKKDAELVRKVEGWSLKTPLGWLREGERGLFTHTKDVREASVYKTRGEAGKAARRAGHSVEVGAVSFERVRVPVGALTELHDEDQGPKTPPYYVIAKGKIPDRLYLAALPLTTRAVWIKFHEHAIHYSSYEEARDTLEKMAREDRGGGLHVASVEHIYTESSEGTDGKRRWAIQFPTLAAWAILGGAGVKTNTTDDLAKATKFSGKKAAREWANHEGGVAVEVTGKPGASEGGKRSETIRPPSRGLDASQGPCVPLHWVVEVMLRGKPHFLKSGRRKKKPIFAKGVEDGERWASEEAARGAAELFAESSGKKARAVPVYMTVKPVKTRRVELYCPGGCRASLTFDVVEGEDQLKCPVCGHKFPVPGEKLGPGEGLRLGVGVVHAWDEEESRRHGTGHVVDMEADRDDGRSVEVRWSKRVMPHAPSTEDMIGFHKPEELQVVYYPDTGEIPVTEKPDFRIKFPGVSSCSSIFEGHACLLGSGGEHEGPHAWWSEEGDIEPRAENNISRIEWDEEGFQLRRCLECGDRFRARTMARGYCPTDYKKVRTEVHGGAIGGMPKLSVPDRVLDGLEELVSMWKDTPSKLEGAEREKAVRYAATWIRALGRALKVACAECGKKITRRKDRRCRKCRKKRTRTHYHDLLERAMAETQAGKSLLPRFIELIHEDMSGPKGGD